MKNYKIDIKYKKIDEIIPYENNPRKNEKAVDKVANSIREFGFKIPIVIDESNIIICGHTRVKAAKKLGLDEVPVVIATDLTDAQIRAFRIADNKVGELAEWDEDLLASELELCEMDMSEFGLESIGEPEEWKKANGSLSEKFLVPPFSVFNAKSGDWQNRKKMWIEKGLKSEVGRKECLISYSKLLNTINGGTSIFDPALCEIVYTWFSKKGDLIIDPFAGGSVRGIVAKFLDRNYTGIDLRKEQIDANFENAKEMNCENIDWICGDSNIVLDSIENDKYNMCLSCPPYADLEIYSDDKSDLSNMPYEEFLKVYSSIISKIYKKLKDDSFCVWVIGEVRNKKGNYYNFLGDTITSFLNAGFNYYNEIILETSIATSALRAGKIFKGGRKICKVHQNVLVFVKGDGKKATKRLGDVDVLNIEEDGDFVYES